MVSNKSHTRFVGEMVEFKLILRCTKKKKKKLSGTHRELQSRYDPSLSRHLALASVNRGFCSELANTWLDTDRHRAKERKRKQGKGRAGGKKKKLKGEIGSEGDAEEGDAEAGEKTSEIK